MSSQPGNMGVAEGMVLVYLTSFTSVFLSIWTVFDEIAASAAWLAPLVGGSIAISLFLVMLYIMERIPGDLYQITETLLGTWPARMLTLLLILSAVTEAVLLLRQFSENTLLTALPDLDMSLATGWYMLLAVILMQLGITAIARAAYVVLPFGLIGAMLILMGLYEKFDIYNLAPWLGNGLASVAYTGLLASGSFAGIFIIPVFAPSFQNIRTMRAAGMTGILLSAGLRAITFFVYTGIFSVEVGREKILPFFEMARLIHLSRFIQRVESFFIILWVIFGILTIAINIYVAAYLLARLLALPTHRPPILALALLASQLAMLPPNIITAITIHAKVSTVFFSSGLVMIPSILFIALLAKGKKGAKSHAL